MEPASKIDKKQEVLALLKGVTPEQMLPLPENPALYFKMDTPGTVLVPMDALQKTRAREEGIARALPFMYAAANKIGNLGKRVPISVAQDADGSMLVVDGNSTYAIAMKSNWKKIPAIMVPMPAGEEAHG